MKKTKIELYTKEQEILLNKIFEILNIDEHNNSFFLGDLDKDKDKQNLILELEVDIKKYFASSLWPCFYCPNIKRKVLSIIKNLVKNMNYNIISKAKFRKNILLTEENTRYKDTIYYFIKNNTI